MTSSSEQPPDGTDLSLTQKHRAELGEVGAGDTSDDRRSREMHLRQAAEHLAEGRQDG